MYDVVFVRLMQNVSMVFAKYAYVPLRNYSLTHSSLGVIEHPKRGYSGSCNTFRFSEISDNVLQMLRDRHIITVQHYKLHVAY